MELLAFPSDEFGGQELACEKIPAFVEGKGLPLDAPGFHVMDKVQTNGPNASPIWRLAKEAFPGDITWNFAGIFVFDKEGTCVARHSVRSPPTLEQINALI